MEHTRKPQLRSFAHTLIVISILLTTHTLAAFAQTGPADHRATSDSSHAVSAGLSGGYNLDFEEDSLGDGRRGWFSTAKEYAPDYDAELSKDDPYHGAKCVHLFTTHTPNGREFGNVMQSFDARPFRGKTMRFRAAVRTDGSAKCRAQMWFRVDRPHRQMGFFDNMDDRPITAGKWGVYDIVGLIDSDATLINIGCMLIGSGNVYIDDVHFDEMTSSAAFVPAQAPKPLTGRALENMLAFAKLYGYVRFFHPSDDVAKANWNNIAINGVRMVESATDAKSLADRLQGFFGHVAPLVRVFASGSKIAVPAELTTRPSAGDKPTAWLHDGVGLEGQRGIYKSMRISADHFGGRSIVTGAYGGVTQRVSATDLRGKRVTFSIFVKSGSAQDPVPIELGIRAERNHVWSDDPVEHAKAMPTAEWTEQSVSASVPADADSLSVSARIYAPTSVWYDDASLHLSDGSTTANLLHNAGFEDGWTGWLPSPTDNYLEDINSGQHHSGTNAAISTSAEGVRAQPTFPDVSRPRTYDLGGGVSCLLPIALYESQTHLSGPGGHTAIDTLASGYYPAGNDRATRLADIIITWNIMQHFWPYFDVVKVDWPGALRDALQEAATDDGAGRFTRTLQAMMAKLHDGHARVSGPSNRRYAPFTTVEADGWVVVDRVAEDYDGELRVGDIIREIDHHPISYWYARIDSITPAATKSAHDYLVYSNLYAALDRDSVVLSITDRDNKFRDIHEAAPYAYPRFARPVKSHIKELKHGIWYVDMNETTKAEFDSALTDLGNADAVIVDMRGYPFQMLQEPISHMIDSTVTSARWNVPMVMYPDRDDWKWDFSNWPIKPAEPRFKHVVHLTDGRAISAAETYMGIIEAYHIGEIVGSTTAGTNGNVNPFTLPGRYSVAWTGMKVLKHDGSQHHGIGIKPTVPCTPTLKGIRAGRDEVLEKGIEVAEKMIRGRRD